MRCARLILTRDSRVDTGEHELTTPKRASVSKPSFPNTIHAVGVCALSRYLWDLAMVNSFRPRWDSRRRDHSSSSNWKMTRRRVRTVLSRMMGQSSFIPCHLSFLQVAIRSPQERFLQAPFRAMPSCTACAEPVLAGNRRHREALPTPRAVHETRAGHRKRRLALSGPHKTHASSRLSA